MHTDESIDSLAQQIYQIRASDLEVERRIHEKSARGELYDDETRELEENNAKVLRIRGLIVAKAGETGADISGIIETLR